MFNLLVKRVFFLLNVAFAMATMDLISSVSCYMCYNATTFYTLHRYMCVILNIFYTIKFPTLSIFQTLNNINFYALPHLPHHICSSQMALFHSKEGKVL
jgi:hypothetical protein